MRLLPAGLRARVYRTISSSGGSPALTVAYRDCTLCVQSDQFTTSLGNRGRVQQRRPAPYGTGRKAPRTATSEASDHEREPNGIPVAWLPLSSAERVRAPPKTSRLSSNDTAPARDMMATATKKPNAADRQHGYELFCDGWMTREQVKEEFGYSLSTIYRLMVERKIRFVKYGDTDNAPVQICRRSVKEYRGRNER